MPGKLQKFEEVNSFKNCFYLSYFEKENGLKLKGTWNDGFFLNNNPIVLELGCGRGEYTIGLAAKNINKNFIGVDIKGARIWSGAKTATMNEMKNVAFIRTRIDFIEQCFSQGEVTEIW
ncbi:MAG: tRNA (guanosine(46)-N7)-methyltransferase TrmB, partial [Bacteroidota bacterium]